MCSIFYAPLPKKKFISKIIVVIVIIAILTLCYSIMSRITLFLLYHANMLTLHNSWISRALWLPQACSYRVCSEHGRHLQYENHFNWHLWHSIMATIWSQPKPSWVFTAHYEIFTICICGFGQLNLMVGHQRPK